MQRLRRRRDARCCSPRSSTSSGPSVGGVNPLHQDYPYWVGVARGPGAGRDRDAVPRRRDARQRLPARRARAATRTACGDRRTDGDAFLGQRDRRERVRRRRVGAARVRGRIGRDVRLVPRAPLRSRTDPTARGARCCSATSRPGAPHMLESLPLASVQAHRVDDATPRVRPSDDHDHRRRARRGRVARDRVARAERHRHRVAGAGRSASRTRPRGSATCPSGPGAGAAPAAQPGVGGDHRRHREPVLHRGGPRHRGRRPRRGPPARAVQLRRGPRQPRRPTSTSSSPNGWPVWSSRSRPRAESSLQPLLDARHPGRRRRPPTGATRDVDSVVVDNRLGAARPRPRTSLEHGATRDRLHHRPEPGRHRERTAARLPATRSPSAGCAGRPRARAAGRLQGGRRLPRRPLAARVARRRRTRSSSPTTR